MPHGHGPCRLHFPSLGRSRWLQRGAGDSSAWISSSWAVTCSLTFRKEWYTLSPGTQDESQDPGHGEYQKPVEIEMPTAAALHNLLILYARLQIITDIQRYTSEQDRVSALLNTYIVSCSSGYPHFHSVAGDNFTFLILHPLFFNSWDYRCHHHTQFMRQTQSFKHAGKHSSNRAPPTALFRGVFKVYFHMCACLYVCILLYVPCACRNWNYEDFDLPEMGD